MKGVFAIASLLLEVATANPLRLQSRAIDGGLFGLFKLTSQYAAAAYCDKNNDRAPGKLVCQPGNCPLVQSADTMTTVEFRDTLATDTTGFVAVDKTNRNIICTFRGSTSARNWLNNLHFFPRPTDICPGCALHEGFSRSAGEVRGRVVPGIRAALDANPGFNVVIAGHSLGGALATITAAEVRKAGIPAALYTYGAPRVGNKAFADFVGAQAGGNFRVTNRNDLVPRLPPREFGYAHVNPEYHIVSVDDDVSADEVTFFANPSKRDGNAGADGFDVDAHGQYFGPISACGDFELVK
ncbi:MAG: hypothetical protein M1815_004486 [Lichina confinis]|nr:MAG: hypothetical protein M1815_004486 [Lichina confinis]